MQPAIETFGLTRSFGAHRAVDNVGLVVPARSVFGFLGPNGAGKTTTLRLVLGLMRPDSGSIAVLGLPLPQARIAIARSVGALVETPALYDHLSGRDNLRATARLIGADASAIDRMLAIVALTHAAGRRVGGYSLGMRQRLALARAMLGRPRLLILDEPTNGLDPEGIDDMRALLRDLPDATGATVLVSSHLLGEVEQTVTHVALMRAGRLITQGPLGEVLGGAGDGELQVAVDDPDTAAALIRHRGLSARSDGTGIIVTGAAIDPAAVNAWLTGAGLRVSRLASEPPSLAKAYARLAGPMLERAA